MSRGAPLPPYIKDPRGGAGWPRGARQESPTPSGSRILPPILVGVGFAEVGRERGGPATSPSPNRTRGGGGAQPPWAAPFSFPLKPTKAHIAPGGFR